MSCCVEVTSKFPFCLQAGATIETKLADRKRTIGKGISKLDNLFREIIVKAPLTLTKDEVLAFWSWYFSKEEVFTIKVPIYSEFIEVKAKLLNKDIAENWRNLSLIDIKLEFLIFDKVDIKTLICKKMKGC